MSLSASLAVANVEVIEGGPRWSYGILAANFARVQILMTWYGGDVDRYLEAIARGDEDADDREFLDELKQRLADDPALLDDMRRIVAEFASRLRS